MKKVIVGLIAMVVLIVGTAVGVAVNASHLKEKEVLEAKDVWVALASQGLFAWPVPGDYSDLSAGGVTPVVYRANNVELLVYEFEDVMARENVSIPYAWAPDDELWIGYLGSWRNLYIGTVAAQEQLLAWQQDRDKNDVQQQSDRLNQIKGMLLDTLSDVQTRQWQVETEQMIYTLEQTAFSMPSPYGKGKLYDNWLVCRLIGCVYKEAPKAQELPVSVSFKASGYRWGHQNIRNDMSWDGQGVFAERLQVSGQGLSRLAPDTITYEIVFERGDLRDEVSFTVDLGTAE